MSPQNSQRAHMLRESWNDEKMVDMEYLVEMKNITKKFPGVIALNHINFDLRPGEVHVLLGENGAGKSTLMKILSGVYEPTEGKLVLEGQEYDRLTPRLSQSHGISIIYQELSVINELSIQENIFLGKLLEKKVLGIKIIDHALMEERTQEVLSEIGLKRKPSFFVGNLSISEKQMVEIAKAIAFKARIIIMDEPTSSLTNEETRQLFGIIRKLKSQGKGIIYISHKLNEIAEVGDRVTVLKDGTYVGTHDAKNVTEEDLVKMMVGRVIHGKYLRDDSKGFKDEIILEVKNLSRKDEYVKNISFNLKRGEILGFSGLVGAGRTELMEAIYGAEPVKSGEIILDGKKLRIKSTHDALKAGIVLVTENRRETGFSPFFNIRQSLSQAIELKRSKFYGLSGLIDLKMEKRLAEEQIKAVQIKCASQTQIITELSGGNQQKVILGKWLASDPRLIIFDEPTKGIDVGTKSEIYKMMRKLSERGIGVMVVSSELPELMAVCDRVIVFNSGKISGEFTSEAITEENMVRAASMAI